MKANRELKRRIKAYLRRHECSITALDVPRKFVRHMSITDAIEFLEQLEKSDYLIEKSEIAHENPSIRYMYCYKYVKKNRNRKLKKLELKEGAKPQDSLDFHYDLFNTKYFDPSKFLTKEYVRSVQDAIVMVASYHKLLDEAGMICDEYDDESDGPKSEKDLKK